jgi:hypothetical protein
MRTLVSWPGRIAFVAVALVVIPGGVGSQQPKQPSPEVAAWDARLPSIRETLNREGLRCPYQPWQVSIIDAAEFARGPSVALVDYCGGGAYTDSITAMLLQNGTPILARFRSIDGAIANGDFVQGASVMHTADVRLMPREHVVYDIHNDTDGGTRLLSCAVNAFVWSPNSRTFEWSRAVTRQATRDYCRNVRKDVLK